MKYKWIKSLGGDSAILFFNGWAMDENVCSQIKFPDYDILVLYNYSSIHIDIDILSQIKSYKNVYVIGWSMGVWAAANSINIYNIDYKFALAINGTEMPIHNDYGIPLRNYKATVKGIRGVGSEAFFSKMAEGSEETKGMKVKLSNRTLEDMADELEAIEKMQSENKTIKWDKAIIGNKDMIIRPKNQYAWWEARTEIIDVDCGHYPFFAISINDIIK